MGLFDFFKKKNKSEQHLETSDGLYKDQIQDENYTVHDLAYHSTKYNEFDKDYEKYKSYFKSNGYNEESFLHNTVGIILKHFYNQEFKEAKELFKHISDDFPKNEDLNWLFIEVIAVIDVKNSVEFVKKYINQKRQIHDFNFQYEVEYQKGLELKSLNYFKEAISIFDSLNKVQPFAWNYYQKYIVKNLLGELDNNHQDLIKAIELDNSIKEDAKTYYELDNLRDNQQFLKIIE